MLEAISEPAPADVSEQCEVSESKRMAVIRHSASTAGGFAWVQIEETRQNVFGFTSWLPMQDELIRHVLEGRDILAVHPTSGGKSMAYMLPAVLWARETLISAPADPSAPIVPRMQIVVSPTNTLCADQVERARKIGISAAWLNSTSAGRVNKILFTLRWMAALAQTLSAPPDKSVQQCQQACLRLAAEERSAVCAAFGKRIVKDDLANVTARVKRVAAAVPLLSVRVCASIAALLNQRKHKIHGLDGNISAKRVRELSEEKPLSLVFVTPEYLVTSWQYTLRPLCRALVRAGILARFIVDEAHMICCCNRPAYLRLDMLRSVVPTCPILALTGTATVPEREFIVKRLQMDGVYESIGSLYRPGFVLRIVKCENDEERFDRAVAQVRTDIDAGNKCGIVFSVTKRGCVEMARRLRAAGIRATPFHADIGKEQFTSKKDLAQYKKELLSAWINPESEHVLCANASCGVGIDNAHCKFVHHIELPLSINDYAQQLGRARGTAQRVSATMFVTVHNDRRAFFCLGRGLSDTDRIQFHRARRTLQDYVDSVECRWTHLCLVYGEKTPPCGSCDNCRMEGVLEPICAGCAFVSLSRSCEKTSNIVFTFEGLVHAALTYFRTRPAAIFFLQWAVRVGFVEEHLHDELRGPPSQTYSINADAARTALINEHSARFHFRAPASVRREFAECSLTREIVLVEDPAKICDINFFIECMEPICQDAEFLLKYKACPKDAILWASLAEQQPRDGFVWKIFVKNIDVAHFALVAFDQTELRARIVPRTSDPAMGTPCVDCDSHLDSVGHARQLVVESRHLTGIAEAPERPFRAAVPAANDQALNSGTRLAKRTRKRACPHLDPPPKWAKQLRRDCLAS